MKKISLLFSLGIVLLLSVQIHAQDTITIVLTGEDLQDAYINNVIPEPYGLAPSLICANWTYYGQPGIGRILINYDLANNSPNLTFLSASIHLFHNPTSGHIGHANWGGDNSGQMVRVTEDWTYEEVSWFNQPGTTNTNAIILPAPETDSSDFLDIDITEMARNMLRNPDRAFGVMLKLANEDNLYTSLVFASSEHENSDLWPRVEMKFLGLPPAQDSVHSYRNSSLSGQEACVYENPVVAMEDPGTLSTGVQEFEEGWSASRTYIKFDLSDLKANDSIIRAELSLFHHPDAASEGHTMGNNAMLFQPILSDWDKNSIAWNNLPPTSEQHQLEIPPAIQSDDDYLNIDVTEMVKEMVKNPDAWHGIMMRMANEETNGDERKAVFASAYHSDPDVRPHLEIITTRTASIPSENIEGPQFGLYPSPAEQTLHIKQAFDRSALYSIYDVKGSCLTKGNCETQITAVDVSQLPKGMYIIRLTTDGKVESQKFMKK